jgi:hypothetical protein
MWESQFNDHLHTVIRQVEFAIVSAQEQMVPPSCFAPLWSFIGLSESHGRTNRVS